MLPEEEGEAQQEGSPFLTAGRRQAARVTRLLQQMQSQMWGFTAGTVPVSAAPAPGYRGSCLTSECRTPPPAGAEAVCSPGQALVKPHPLFIKAWVASGVGGWEPWRGDNLWVTTSIPEGTGQEASLIHGSANCLAPKVPMLSRQGPVTPWGPRFPL